MGGKGFKRNRVALTGSSRLTSDAGHVGGGGAKRAREIVSRTSSHEEAEASEDEINAERAPPVLPDEGEESQPAPALQMDGENGAGKRRGGVFVVLEEACLEVVKSRSGKFELLNCDDHLALHSRLRRDPQGSRPDIAHQMLLALLDSPLNKAGLLRVLVRTASGVLIEIDPSLRIPRTFKRFAGLMVQLLHRLRVRAKEGSSKTLLRVIKNPVTDHLPVQARRFSTSVTGTLVDVYEFVDHLPSTDPVVFVFGAMAVGKVSPDYCDTCISLSRFPLSGACAVGRLLGAFERRWGIV